MKRVVLSKLCTIIIGRTPSRSISKYWGKGHKWVSISDMKEEFVNSTKEEITDEAISSIRCRKIPKGTLLLSFKLSVGKLAFAGTDLYTNEAIAALVIKDQSILFPKYLFYALKITPLVGGNQAAMGITLNSKSLAALKIPIRSLDDQIRIATILSKAEALIAKRKESIRLLDELLKSTFLEMFGDPVKNEKGWDIVPLSKLGSLDRGVSKHRPRNAPHLLGGKYPLIQTGDVANAGTYIIAYNQTYSEKGFQQSKLWKAGTLCITIAANIAKTGIVTFDACFPDSVVGFVNNENESNSLYVHFLFGFFQRVLEKNAPQAAQKNINLEILRTLKVPKPDLALQNKFAQIAEKVETIKSKYETSLEELDNLYGSLSQRAFRGELDLSKVPINVIVSPEPIQATAGSISPTVEISKRFTKQSLLSLIKKMNGETFSFNELWDLIEHSAFEPLEGGDYFEELPEMEELQSLIIENMESNKPVIEQVFDFLSSEATKNDAEKQIAFRVKG